MQHYSEKNGRILAVRVENRSLNVTFLESHSLALS